MVVCENASLIVKIVYSILQAALLQSKVTFTNGNAGPMELIALMCSKLGKWES
jgi:hypothetical protein